jgi:hypothetical protein
MTLRLLARIGIAAALSTGCHAAGPAPPAYSRPAQHPPIDVAALAAHAAAPCPAFEATPGNWVRFACGPRRWPLALPIFLRPAAPHGIVSSLPAEIDHRRDGSEGPMRSQGVVGSCTAVSLASASDHALRRIGIGDDVSSIHLWSRYGIGFSELAYHSNAGEPLASERVWPYDSREACRMERDDTAPCGPAYGVRPNSGDDPVLVGKRHRADAAGGYRVVGLEALADRS